ncbi:MAG TPA: glycosyltransferase family 2 protein [Verrucomicrobiae bacterium]|nr:glycosyltransferase family 2 protein [Verrucomicrobiae bacterium]
MNISVLILTYNEEANLVRCLDSVKWSNDVLVVDSFSTDRTVELAKNGGARVLQNSFVDFASQRNFGLAQGSFKHDWVLHLDADEVVTAALQQELMARAADDKKEAYRLASKMMFQGRWLRYSGLYPSYQVRFGKRDRLNFIQVGHGQREQLEPVQIGTLREPLLHFSFSKGIADWVERHNRYSTAEAVHFMETNGVQAIDWRGVFVPGDVSRHRRALKVLFGRLPGRPTLRFLYMYLFRLGFLDGRAGFTYCLLLAMYEYMTILKIRELRRRRDSSTL